MGLNAHHALFLALAVATGACDHAETEKVGQVVAANVREVATPVLQADEDKMPYEEELEGNLFGKFFCDRAEFYVIESPNDRIYNAQARSLTLYYLDGVLSKKKYRLTVDIHAELIKSLGNFSITGFDRKNYALIKKGEILVRTRAGLALNKALDNYELKWETENGMVSYRVKFLNGRPTYHYIEKELTYESHFKSLEMSCG